jgi:WD40 repeat protein
LRAARLAAGGSRLRSRKVHFVLWPAAAIFIVGGTTLVLSAFLDANQASKPLSSKVQSSAPAAVSGTPIPVRQASWASFNEAERQFQLGEWKEAIAFLARAIKFDPANQVASERFFQELIVHREKALPPLIASFGHQDTLYALAFSPDGARILTASWDKTAKLWDAISGKLMATFAHQGAINRQHSVRTVPGS